MTQEPRDRLEEALANMTRWEGPAPGLWRAALEQDAGAPQAPGSAQRAAPAPSATTTPTAISSIRTQRAALAAAAMLLLAVTLGIIVLPQLARDEATQVAQQRDDLGLRAPAPARPFADLDRAEAAEPSGATDHLDAQTRADIALGHSPKAFLELQGSPWRGGAFARGAPGERAAGDAHDEPRARLQHEPAQRIRSTVVELHAEDVRAAFAQAILIPSQSRGEYVESSVLAGDAEQSIARLTLNIGPDRVEPALESLRTHAHIHDRRSTDIDISTQLAQVDAHLRDERQLQSRLRQRLERPGDPLDDGFALRLGLEDVDQRIEQLSAMQRDLQRSLSLATLHIIIRPAPPAQPAPPAPPTPPTPPEPEP